LSFPANNKAIKADESESKLWKRPTELEDNPSLWGSKGISEFAGEQGGIGNCWLMASIDALGEHPEYVKKIFRNITEYPKDGKFELEFWYMGKYRRVTIDDKLPGYIDNRGKWAP